MKILLLIAFFVSCLSANADEPEIGIIVAKSELEPKNSAIDVSYEYDGEGKLVLSIQNIAMNAAAKGVVGSVVIKGMDIFIRPRERYDANGPVESTQRYTIQYVIQNVKPGRYSLYHDDSDAEGQDRQTKLEIDLTVAGKGKKTVTFEEPNPSKDPFAE